MAGYGKDWDGHGPMYPSFDACMDAWGITPEQRRKWDREDKLNGQIRRQALRKLKWWERDALRLDDETAI